jgi:CubicO group peptidase (beta-lactamase class C family)
MFKLTRRNPRSCCGVEDGTRAPSDPLKKFYPDGPASWQPITIRHLLTHTSGERSAGMDRRPSRREPARRGARAAPINPRPRIPNVQRRRLKPVRMLTRAPVLDVAIAKLKGTCSPPDRTVIPAAATSPTPSGVMFGPSPNSVPL